MSCEKCGGRMNKNAKYGVCQRNPDCRKANRTRAYRQRADREPREFLSEGEREKRKRARAHRERVQKERPGEITYLLWSDALGLYKIGHTGNLKHRLSVLSCGLPGHVELLAEYPIGRTLEYYLQQELKEYRQGDSEWFRLPIEPGQVPAYISEVAEGFSEYAEALGSLKKSGKSRYRHLALMGEQTGDLSSGHGHPATGYRTGTAAARFVGAV